MEIFHNISITEASVLDQLLLFATDQSIIFLSIDSTTYSLTDPLHSSNSHQPLSAKTVNLTRQSKGGPSNKLYIFTKLDLTVLWCEVNEVLCDELNLKWFLVKAVTLPRWNILHFANFTGGPGGQCLDLRGFWPATFVKKIPKDIVIDQWQHRRPKCSAQIATKKTPKTHQSKALNNSPTNHQIGTALNRNNTNTKLCKTRDKFDSKRNCLLSAPGAYYPIRVNPYPISPQLAPTTASPLSSSRAMISMNFMMCWTCGWTRATSPSKI